MEQVNYNSGEVLESLNNKLDRDFNNMAVNSVNFAKYSNNVTNCITEIPQDIKLELVDGTLTLKAGSKIRIPNGKNLDDSLKFDEFINETDIICTFDNTNQKMVFFHPEKTVLWHCNASSQQFSGDTQPTTSWGYWYDTKNNIIKHTINGSDWTTGFSLPLCIATGNDNGIATSIDQVFNGFGYIGSTVFALPNVKGLIPNGRNEDGTLNSIEFITQGVNIETRADYGTNTRVIKIGSDYISGMAEQNYTYDEVNNYNYEINNLRNCAILGKLVTTDNVITSFVMPTTFHTVAHSDSSWLSGLGMPSNRYIDLKFGATGTSYTAPANGWFYFKRASDGTNTSLSLENNTKGYMVETTTSLANPSILLPVVKNDVVRMWWINGATDNVLRFYYAEGEK